MLVLAAAMLLGGADLRVEFPLDDTPFNQRHGAEPSMEQSLALSVGFTTLGDWAIDLGLERAFRGKRQALRWLVEVPATLLWSVLLAQLPFGGAWTHEEWHRAVMTSHGVRSRNGVYTAPPFSIAISVDHVADAELSRFKASAPADFVRMSSAGLEANVEHARRLERQWFFDDRPPFRDHLAVAWAFLNSFFYLGGCAMPLSDQITDGYNATETDPADRDFTGMDCTAWAYDLDRPPDEPYQARGTHPLGNGINRYRSWRDLSGRARSFLQAAWWLSLATLVTPGWFTSSLPGVGGSRWTFGVLHQLTSFGQTLDLEVYLRVPKLGEFLGVVHGGFGFSSFYPGLELAFVRAPIAKDVRLSVTLMAWLQEKPGGMLRLRADWQVLEHAYLWAEGDAKTAGWVSGVVYTTPAVELRLGIGAVL